MNKKANFRDIPEYIIFAIVFGFLVFIAGNILINIDTRVNANPELPTESKTASGNLLSSFTKFHDYAFPFMYLAYFLFSIVMARLIPSNPKFIIIGVIYMLGLTLAAMFVENVWDGFSNAATFTAISSQLTFIPFMLDHLVFLVLFYCGGVALALYTKDV